MVHLTFIPFFTTLFPIRRVSLPLCQHLFHTPLVNPATFLLGLLKFQFQSFGEYGSELHGAGYALEAGIVRSVSDRLPMPFPVPVIQFPMLGDSTSAPGTVVEPIDGACAYALGFLEFVAEPFRAVLLGPPMGVGHRTVSLVSRYQAVVDCRKGR